MPTKNGAKENCAAKLRLLANPTRMRVLRALLEAGPLHVWEINERANVEASLLSHHLRVLRDAGLVEAERDGRAVLYRLARGAQPARGRGVDLACCVLSFPEGR